MIPEPAALHRCGSLGDSLRLIPTVYFAHQSTVAREGGKRTLALDGWSVGAGADSSTSIEHGEAVCQVTGSGCLSDGDDGTPCGRRSGRARLSGAFAWNPPNTEPASRQKRP